MNKFFVVALLLLSFLSLGATHHPERFILKGEVPDGVQVLKDLGMGRFLVENFPGFTVEESIDIAMRGRRVEYAEPDHMVFADLVPTETIYTRGDQPEHQLMDSEEAWDITTGSPDILIAIIDTGVTATHFEIAPRWVEGFDFFQDIPGGYETQFHGTHVAGTAVAAGFNGHTVGLCWECSITSYKFLGCCGSGFTSDGIQAIDAAVAAGADVLNNSWSGSGFNQSLVDSISAACDAGVVFVAAAGNNGRDTDINPKYPASYTNPCIISVGASDDFDNKASFSNFGSVSVDLLAPGVTIWSNAGPKEGSQCRKANILDIAILSGTSMAAPQVAGTAGLLLSANPGWTWVEVIPAILDNVDIIPAASQTVSGGRLNVARALGATPPDPDPDPTSCGNGVCDEGEYCGAGPKVGKPDACESDCPRVRGRRSRRLCCGNGVLEPTEEELCPENP